MSTPYIGEIRLAGFNYAPEGWLMCQGQLLQIDSEYRGLFLLIGTTYGGDGVSTFALPDLRGGAAMHLGTTAQGNTYTLGQQGGAEVVTLDITQIPQHVHSIAAQNGAVTNQVSPSGAYFATSTNLYGVSSQLISAPVLTTVGGSLPHENRMPYLVLNYMIAWNGIFPTGPTDAVFIGQISPFSFGNIPKGWAPCNGQLLPVNANQPLFSLIRNTYGGNGTTNFALPNLQGAFPLGFTTTSYKLGATGGEANYTLQIGQIPSHNHLVAASTAGPNSPLPSGNYPSAIPSASYATQKNTTLGTGSSPAGGGLPHNNLPPYLAISYCIALQGIYPSQG